MAAILGFIEPEIAPFDLPSPNTPRIKHEVDRMTRCGDMAIQNSIYHDSRGCAFRTSIWGEGDVERGMVDK